MKQSVCAILACLSLLLLCGCASTQLGLELNGVKRSTIMGHNQKVRLGGGKPSGGKYSGPGVKDGYFTPSAAGNGTHEITYSKLFHGSATAQITVYGAPTPPMPCRKCDGKKSIPCPDCYGKGKVKRTTCIRCKGKGEIACTGCVDVDLNPTTEAMVLKVLTVFSTCRLKLGKKEQTLELSRIQYDEQETLKPTMSYLKAEKKIPYTGHSFNKINSAAPVSFVFPKKLSQFEDDKISSILVNLQYGKCDVKLFYDLKDVQKANGELPYSNGELSYSFVYPRRIFFEGRIYSLPYGLFVIDPKNNFERQEAKDWRDIEIRHNWHYQEKNKKGHVRIIDDRGLVVFFSNDAKLRKKSDMAWSFVKDWLNKGNDGFWKEIIHEAVTEI